MLLDINIILALLWEDHEAHERAIRWRRRLTRYFTCPLGQLGFVRISSQPKLGYTASPQQACKLLWQLLADPRHQFISDDLSCDERILFIENIPSPKAITDHCLVALARKHQFTLATLDVPLSRAFAHEPGLVELIPY